MLKTVLFQLFTVLSIFTLQSSMPKAHKMNETMGKSLSVKTHCRGAGAGLAAAGPMLEAKLIHLTKGWLQRC